MNSIEIGSCQSDSLFVKGALTFSFLFPSETMSHIVGIVIKVTIVLLTRLFYLCSQISSNYETFAMM